VLGVGYLGGGVLANVSAVVKCSAGGAAERMTECRVDGWP
jgi:hypothetical protein